MTGRDNGIVVSGLSREFKGGIKAVDGIDLEVAPGEIYGFLGPNGAGKSTTIGMLCTLVAPSAGTARVAGFDVLTERALVRQNIGLVFQDQTLDAYLSCEQNLRFHAELYGMAAAQTRRRTEEVLEMVGLLDRRKAKVETLSGGMRRRLEIARGLMHAPRVLFLDEPTVGLDPQTRLGIWSYIRGLRDGYAGPTDNGSGPQSPMTIFMTTHYMEEAEHCDRIAIIDQGRIVALDTPQALKAGVGTDRVRLNTDDDRAAIDALANHFGVAAIVRDGAVEMSIADGERFVPRLFAELDVPIRQVSVARPSLDDVFLAYTGKTIRDAEAGGNDQMRQMVSAMRGARR